MTNIKDLVKLAEGLKQSNIEEVKALAEGFLTLTEEYRDFRFKASVKQVMEDHASLLERLKD